MIKRVILVLILALSALPLLADSGYTKAKGIDYRSGSGIGGCTLDVSYIKKKADMPVVVWFHGGSLTGGKNSTPKALLTGDCVVVSVAYRLYPEVPVSDIIDDAAAAVAWVVGNISSYGGAAAKIYLAGHSAGGYLVAMLGLDRKYLAKYGVNADSFAAIVPYSGQMITHFTERKARGIDITRPVIDSMAPLYHVRPDAAPFLVITADRNQEMVRRYEENAYFVEMMKYVGHKDIVLYEEGGFNHGGMTVPGHQILLKYIREREN